MEVSIAFDDRHSTIDVMETKLREGTDKPTFEGTQTPGTKNKCPNL
jgi:uncharacterized protein YheU (UPF0270 family)